MECAELGEIYKLVLREDDTNVGADWFVASVLVVDSNNVSFGLGFAGIFIWHIFGMFSKSFCFFGGGPTQKKSIPTLKFPKST